MYNLKVFPQVFGTTKTGDKLKIVEIENAEVKRVLASVSSLAHASPKIQLKKITQTCWHVRAKDKKKSFENIYQVFNKKLSITFRSSATPKKKKNFEKR